MTDKQDTNVKKWGEAIGIVICLWVMALVMLVVTTLVVRWLA